MTAIAAADIVTGAISRSRPARIAARTGGGALRIFLVVVGLIWLVPTIGLLVESLRNPAQYANGGWWNALAHPAQLTFSNYSALLKNHAITSSFLNTIEITVPARDWLFLIVVGLLVIPIQIALIPVVRLYSIVGISGSLYSLWIFHIAFGLPFAIFLLRNYFAGIPRDLIEAARMDGGSDLLIFRRIIMPLGLPAIASLGIFQFLWVWNDLLVALIFSNASTQPLTVALASQTRQFGNSIDILASGAFLSLIIPLGVFLAFQRFFVQGVLAGSVK